MYLPSHMPEGIDFFTATCLNWQYLLEPDKHKEIIMNSLTFLVQDKRIWLYGFVIMSNHIHLLWRKQDQWENKNIQQSFLKYTAQQIKFNLLEKNPAGLIRYKSTQADRKYHFWERRAFTATICNRKILEQKLNYIHYNPVKAGMCKIPEQYHFSSARYYEINKDEWGIITHYMEHL